jgi:hypothetical protein
MTVVFVGAKNLSMYRTRELSRNLGTCFDNLVSQELHARTG